MTDDYNNRAPTYELTDPTQIEPPLPVAYEDTTALLDEMSALAHQALAVQDVRDGLRTKKADSSGSWNGQSGRCNQISESYAAVTREMVHTANRSGACSLKSGSGRRFCTAGQQESGRGIGSEHAPRVRVIDGTERSLDSPGMSCRQAIPTRNCHQSPYPLRGFR